MVFCEWIPNVTILIIVISTKTVIFIHWLDKKLKIVHHRTLELIRRYSKISGFHGPPTPVGLKLCGLNEGWSLDGFTQSQSGRGRWSMKSGGSRGSLSEFNQRFSVKIPPVSWVLVQTWSVSWKGRILALMKLSPSMSSTVFIGASVVT